MPLLREHAGQHGWARNGPVPAKEDRSGHLDEAALPELNIGGTLHRKVSEESIRTELCEGPLLDSPRPSTPERVSEQETTTVTDRAELIERLKRGESPTWVPSRTVSLGMTVAQ